ncbi:partner of Y14 and mago [Platysternon megacephalum]|uniref:Partner of Y14 and mago n=1 Tax=Platysternon megacephalum TaxID=55544 RepID=A0A4D9EBU1_9SAUR|nr:partner of Y14 and mago [Platysternon megacephalum]
MSPWPNQQSYHGLGPLEKCLAFQDLYQCPHAGLGHERSQPGALVHSRAPRDQHASLLHNRGHFIPPTTRHQDIEAALTSRGIGALTWGARVIQPPESMNPGILTLLPQLTPSTNPGLTGLPLPGKVQKGIWSLG